MGAIRKDGLLTVTLREHTVLVVEPDERYEAFHMTGSRPPIDRGFRFVAVPGRALARL
jgi:hypothetical protein